MNKDNFVLVEFTNNINNVLSETFKIAQRIKLTCFDVSNNYIIFGASSGGIYIFKKQPCQFLKLIPSKEGSTSTIRISPDERNLAISNSNGLVIILQEFFNDSNLRYQVFTEHEGQNVTSIIWNDNDIYCGDNRGKVSVVTLASKAMFHVPSATLMQLDSEIVQLDAYQQFLLVSTKKRSFLCDTENEQFKQIGKKLRDGHFGACFFNTNPNIKAYTYDYSSSPSSRKYFQTIKDEESFLQVDQNGTNAKIYCARPGCRLWEANFEPNVLMTHQFRNAKLDNSEVLIIPDDLNNGLSVKKIAESQVTDFNFTKIYTILTKFLLTFDADNVYIIDLNSSRLVYWIRNVGNIFDLVINNTTIYIWRRNKLEFKIFSLLKLEDLIMHSLLKKQYYLCADICNYFSQDVLNLIETSRRIHLISIIKEKLSNLIVDKLEEGRNKHPSVSLIVNNGVVSIEENNCANETVVSAPAINNTTCSNNKILAKQYKLNKTHPNVQIPDMRNLLEDKSLDEIYELFDEYLTGDGKRWCQMQMLQHITKLGSNWTCSQSCLDFLIEAFIAVNKCNDLESNCKCGFPLPKAHTETPKHYEISATLINKSNKLELFLKEVPYYYRLKVSDSNLTLLMQYSDLELLQKYSSRLSYDAWDDLIKLFIKLKAGLCLNCDAKIDVSKVLSWSTLGILLVACLGAINGTKLLKRYASFIPNGELNATFYQACMFSSIASDCKKDHLKGFLQKFDGLEIDLEFGNAMQTYLQMKYLSKTIPKSVALQNSNLNCTCCNLNLSTPVIGNSIKLNCGHSFHRICLSRIKHSCNICTGTDS